MLRYLVIDDIRETQRFGFVKSRPVAFQKFRCFCSSPARKVRVSLTVGSSILPPDLIKVMGLYLSVDCNVYDLPASYRSCLILLG
jgi:hypothetical protein